MQISWSPLALDRLQDIVSYIALDNPAAADDWLTDVFAAVERLADFPLSGRVVPEVGVSRIREVILGNYRIIYSSRDPIQILTVRSRWQHLSSDALDGDEDQ